LTAQQITPGDYDSWHDRWFGLGQRLQAEAENSESGGHSVVRATPTCARRTTTEMLSSICTGRRTTRGSTGAFNLSIEMFRRAAKLFEVPIEPVEIPFEGTSLPGYFYSAGRGKRPTVVVCSGFDGTVEENHF
jgi:hypothetical protein